MVIGFFELRLSGLLRFPLWLHPHLESNSNYLKLVYYYEQDDVRNKSEVLSRFPKNVSLIKVGRLNKDEILGQLSSQNLDKLIVMAQRIPDSCLVAAAKKLSIKTVMYQHGLYVPFMKRQGSLFVLNLMKAFRFLQYASATADIIGVSRIRLIGQYIRIFILGHGLTKMRFPGDSLNVDVVLVYGEFWKEYHNNQFGYSYDQQYVVGAPDFTDISQLASKLTEEKTVCYIAQTLVEDGRLRRSAMETFISNLSKSVSTLGLKLYVRLHPRSDLSLYDCLPSDTIFSKTDFPKTVVYVGHYSSILAKATFLSDKIVLVAFPGHEFPDYIDMLGCEKVEHDNYSALAQSLEISIEHGVDSDAVCTNIRKQDHYFDSSIANPLATAAIQILEI